MQVYLRCVPLLKQRQTTRGIIMQRRKFTALHRLVQPTLISLALASSGAYAAPGDLDPSFGGKGWVTAEIGGDKDSANYAFDVIQQTDGKLLTVGSSFNGANEDFAIYRYNNNGTLDTSFSGDGKAYTGMGLSNDVAHAVVQQADGKLVVAGYAWVGNATDIAVARYNLDGSLDSNFGNQGIVVTSVNAEDDEARDVIVQTDGKIVIAGTSNRDFVVVRYNSNGTLDTSFDSDGKVTTPILSSTDTGYSLIQDTNGKLVVAGTSYNGLDDDIAIVRYNTDGSLDTSFDTDGIMTYDPGSTGLSQGVADIIQQSDGKLVIAGKIANNPYPDFMLLRFSSAGVVDTAFGTGGMVQTAFGTRDDTAYKVRQQSDGKLVAMGAAYSDASNNSDFAIARYNTNGSLDTSFGTGGRKTFFFGSTNTGNEVAYAGTIQTNGQIVVAGLAYTKGGDADFALARVNTADGSLDTSFDTDGRLTTTGGAPQSKMTAIMQQADGKLVAAGYQYTSPSLQNDFAVLRYNTDGTLDTSFSGDGLQTTGFGTYSDFATSVIQITKGIHANKIVVAGYETITGTNSEIAIAMYREDGSPETSFASSGKYNTGVSINIDEIYDIIERADGRLLAVGQINTGAAQATANFGAMCFNSTGSKYNTFGGVGSVNIDFNGEKDTAYGVVEQPDSKLVLVGTTYEPELSSQNIAIARINNTGVLDTSFGVGGKVTTEIGTAEEIAYDVILLPSGKLAVTGTRETGGTLSIVVLMYNDDGSLDTTFGTNGYTIISNGVNNISGRSIKLQPDSKLVVGGYTTINSINSPIAVRLLADGSLDTTFGSGGKVIISTGLNSQTGGMVVQKDGKYAFAGNTIGATNALVGRVLVEDTDSDGFGDAYDNCPIDANADQLNTDGDAQGNVCDSDDDNDGVPDINDAFPLNANESVDTDGDGYGDNSDNCPLTANANQANLDGDAFGDVCDGDIDGDGASNTVDSDPYNALVKTEILLPLNNGYHGSNVKDTQSKQ
jgi:uncharacterized delta-60 repeat protein